MEDQVRIYYIHDMLACQQIIQLIDTEYQG